MLLSEPNSVTIRNILAIRANAAKGSGLATLAGMGEFSPSGRVQALRPQVKIMDWLFECPLPACIIRSLQEHSA